MRKLELLLLVLVVGIGVGVLVNQVNAQGGSGVGISPLTFELTAEPGDVIINQLKVFNPSDAIVGIKMEVEDFTVSGELGHVKLEPAETETYSIARWVAMEPGEFVLEPRGQRLVNFTISVPEKAEPGGHYGSVLAGTTGVIGGEFMGAAVAGRVGVLVLLNVSGEVTEDLEVKDFISGEMKDTSKGKEFRARSYFEYGPVSFQLRFENKGTVHVKPAGFVTITNFLGKKVIDIPFTPSNVLPNSVRKIEAYWSGKWHLGKFTATLSGSYGDHNTPFPPAVLTFWVIPWKLISGGFVALVLLLLFFYLTRRRWRLALRILLKGEKA